MLYLLPYSLWCFLNIFSLFFLLSAAFAISLSAFFPVVTSLLSVPFPTSLLLCFSHRYSESCLAYLFRSVFTL